MTIKLNKPDYLLATLLLLSGSWMPVQAGTDCRNGLISIPDNDLVADIQGHCEKMSIMGDGNNITVESVNKLHVGGNNNTILLRSKGSSFVKWFGGDGNSVQLLGDASNEVEPANNALSNDATEEAQAENQNEQSQAGDNALTREALEEALKELLNEQGQTGSSALSQEALEEALKELQNEQDQAGSSALSVEALEEALEEASNEQ